MIYFKDKKDLLYCVYQGSYFILFLDYWNILYIYFYKPGGTNMLFDFIVNFMYSITHREEIKRYKQELEEAAKPENRHKPRVYYGRGFGYFVD